MQGFKVIKSQDIIEVDLKNQRISIEHQIKKITDVSDLISIIEDLNYLKSKYKKNIDYLSKELQQQLIKSRDINNRI